MAVLGIDTHKDVHVAIVLDDLGRVQVAESFGTTDRDNCALVHWARQHGPITRPAWRARAATATASPGR